MSSSSREKISGPVRIANVALWLGGLALASAGVGVLGVQVGALTPMQGFTLFGAAAVLGGVLTLLLGLVGVVATRGSGVRPARRRAWLATAIGASLVAVVVVAGSPGRGLPAINDITTNLSEPPAFRAAAQDPANIDRDMAYPAAFVPQVQAAYPDLVPIGIDAGREVAYRRARDAARALGWEITWEDPAGTGFEARDVSAIFRFVDDVAIRVRESEAGAVIDVRSKSRDGRGDLGVNAERIQSFAARVRPTAPVGSE